MATDYPNGIDAFNNPTATDYLDSATVPHADQHANANDAIEAIEAELGTNPKGTYASVKARLDAATADDTANEVVKRDANQSFSIGAITFDPNSPQTSAAGKLYFDGNGSLALGLLGGNVTVGINEDIVCYVTNAEATTLNIGEVVYLFGAQGDRPTVKRASNTSEATSSKTFGFVAESIAAGQTGFVTIRGTVRKVDTGSYTAGDSLYLGSTAGTFTKTKPSAPNHLVYLGVVERANSGNGQIQVVVQNGYELEELHNVAITSVANGQTLFYNSTSGLWENKSFSATAPITYDASTRTIAANTGVANGLATLDSTGKVPQSQLPAVAITNTYVVNSQAAMLALTAEEGDVAIRTDVSKSFILTATPASILANWQELLSPGAVTSVDGRVGTVTLSDLYAPLTRTISTTAPLSGGGDLSANRTLSIADASTTGKGAVQLTDSTSSTSTTTAATPNSVKSAYDLANTANTTANAAAPKTTTISTTAPIAGGGDLSANRTLSLNIGSSLTTSASNLIVDSTIVPYLANANTFNNTNIFKPNADANKGLIVRQNSGSQSANLVEWQDSTGANIFGGVTSAGFTFVGASASGGWLGVNIGNAAQRGIVVKGAASQTANLQEWQNSAGSVLASITAAGTARLPIITDVAGTGPLIYMNAGSINLQTRVSANPGLYISGASNQTGDLLQWQNSANSALGGANALSQIFTGSTSTIKVATGGATTAASGDGTTATITTTSAHGLAVGDLVTVAGVTPTGYNGTFLVTAVTSTTISYANATTGSQTVAGTVSAPAQASVTARSAGTQALRINAAANSTANTFSVVAGSSQTGDIAQFVGTTATTQILSTGGIRQSGNVINSLGRGTLASTILVIGTNQTGNVGLVVQGVASQTADLQQWQNSSGTVLAKVDKDGNIFTNTATAGTNTTQVATTAFVATAVAGAGGGSAGDSDQTIIPVQVFS